MPSNSALSVPAAKPSFYEGWQGIVLIACTYIYFLIFAQFGFLKRLAQLGIGDAGLLPVMAGMAIGGIGMSLLAPRSKLWNCPSCRVQSGLIGCALAAFWSLLPLGIVTAICTAVLIGISLGVLTVTLVANLPLWIGADRALLKAGIGTGAGYLVCNIPALFTASPASIAIASGLCCVVALVVANRSRFYAQPLVESGSFPGVRLPFAMILVWFTALVWLDSAAFYIIQNSAELKAGTWEGTLHLWRAGGLHLAAAVLSAWILARRGVAATLMLSLAALSGACLLLLNPGSIPLAGTIYPIGVSVYSVALVAYPSLLMPAASGDVRAWRAGSLYAIAGWIGSAMGIGMARNLHHVPMAFVAVAAALFVCSWVWFAWRSTRVTKSAQIQVASIAAIGMLTFALMHILRPPVRAGETAIERGHRIYIGEGCINCHSQYVRPNSSDVLMWGPVTSVETIHQQKPPLIGNRRQGPDLSQVGTRRSPLWLRMHFANPRDVSYGSIMPRYDYLFLDGRGDDLIAYLSSLSSPGHWAAVNDWLPDQAAVSRSSSLDGGALFKEHCATCHSPDGTARNLWASRFHRLPPDLAGDELKDVPADSKGSSRAQAIDRIVKFGIKGTDMAGHEYLPDEQIAALSRYVLAMRARDGH